MNQGLPTVSVVTIFFNAGEFLEEAVESVLAQTCQDWELLLVDDGSSDGSSAIARRYADTHPTQIRYLEHSGHQNLGVPKSRNTGLRNARGKYVAWLDSDDVWLPHKLSRQLEILRAHPSATLLYGASTYWRSWQREQIERDITPGAGIEADRLYRPQELLRLIYPLLEAPAPCVSSLIFRRDVALALGGIPAVFCADRQLYEDQAFLVKFYLSETIYVSSEIWDRYREHPTSCCAKVIGAGKYDAVRGFFLNWFADYLWQQRCADPRIWWHLKRAQLPYQHPYYQRVLQFLARRFAASAKD